LSYRLIWVAAMLLASPVEAQVMPAPGTGDPHIQSVLYDPDQVVRLQVAANYQLTVEFAADERIENIAVGDSGAWAVTANRRGDHLFIKTGGSGVTTNMTVLTDARSYTFELQPLSGAAPNMAYTVRFRYPAPSVAVVALNAVPPTAGRYRLSGASAIRPQAIDDDGVHTYMTWAPDQPLPAVFAIDRLGHETLVNGAVRDGRFVIDTVAKQLVFRLDEQIAGAVRVLPRKPRKKH
jgi:type IV secretion system protein VirB9